MRIASSGNIGLGTSSPNAKIDVRSGSIRVTHTGTTRYAQMAYDGIYSRGQNMYLWNNTANAILFGTNSVHRMQIDSNGHFRPAANNTYDLGTSSIRWRNVYTNDLNLSNEGSTNDVDGTWGNFTIQEGEDDLFLINRRSGKKYKFNLTEVS